MIRLSLTLWLALALPALAAPVRVTSGEHEGFTRLVLDYANTVNWQVGRSADGYELRLDGPVPAYDLRQAFDLIGKSRLAAIWLDPVSGALHIGLACACHAIPFEFRPGIVVIDLKDGPPPKGSAFEETLEGETAAPLGPAPLARPKPRPQPEAEPAQGYDWLTVTRDAASTAPPSLHTPQILPPDPALQPLRDTLLQQMAQGAAAGVVDMEKPRAGPGLPETAFPLAQIRIGDSTENLLKPDSSIDPDLTAKGEACLAADHLALADWGDPQRPFADQLSESRLGLTGEFDRPDAEAIARAVRFQLFLGFGAEARQTTLAFAPGSEDAKVWVALAYLLDADEDPTHLFRGMAACDGPAALWALLDEPLSPGEAVANGAIRLAFSDLPLHLRQLLGPRLAERFLTLGDEDSARALQDAIRRAPSETTADVALMEAQLDLHQGDPAAAEAAAQELLADPGPDTPEALIALAEARARQGLPLGPETALALQALLREHEGSALAPRLRAAWILAEAAAGHFDAALAALDGSPEVTPEVWNLTAELAPDADFLVATVLPPDDPLPHISPDLRITIARRLLGLGLAGPADRWLRDMTLDEPILAAQIALGRHDGRSALTALAGSESEEAQQVKLRALELTGQEVPRAALLASDDNPEAAAPALARAGDWASLAATGTTPWAEVANRLQPTTPPAVEGESPGPLATGRNLLVAGNETRMAIETLLASLPVPTKP